MVKLAEYSRTATFAWSHERIPSLVTGSVAGTVDANFSSESSLELWSLLSPDAAKPTNSLTVDAKFNDLDWSEDNKTIAGALDNGVVELFSCTNSSLKSEASFKNHAKSAKTVRFNAKQSNILASGGTQGEIFIWDLSTCLKSPIGYKPLSPGASISSIDEVTSLSWNQCLAHVFASAGSSTYASIWDLKAKKEVIHLSYSSPVTGLKSQLSVVEWHPNNSTRVATATGSDNEPLILVWDLRNANTPLQTLAKGHSKGILSLDWCNEDENLLLSSGRDSTIVLWNPESGEELTQYPTRGNWCFKSKFAPAAPDLFASASFDNKIQVQTLQNLVTTLDQEESATKQKESETDFWNHVSQEESNEKPTLLRLQAPSWYGDKSPAAHWAFGGKLVRIMPDGKSVSITKPKLPGLEENHLLDAALKSNDYNPLINRRLAKTIDDTNEEDWNLLEKLSMDGKAEFLKESFAFDDEETDRENHLDDGENFFANIEGKYEPSGTFSLSTSLDTQLSKDLLIGNVKSAVATSLEKGLLLEALIIALDSDDKILKDSVKNSYFSKYAKESPLSRFLHSISYKSSTDLVNNLDVAQWKYAARAIIEFYGTDSTKKNEQLVALADRLIESGNRQDALVVYLAANSLDKVATVWLKEFSSLEQKLQKEKSSLYEAHSECLSEFVERFTVFSKFVGDDTIITNEDLIGKFLEYVNLESASGSFELAYAILESLPASNEEVKMEKQRVLLASGNFGKATTTSNARRTGYGTTANNSIPAGVPQYSGLPSSNSFISTNPMAAGTFGSPQVRAMPPVTASSFTPKSSVQGLSTNSTVNNTAPKYAPITTSPAVNPLGVHSNPYAVNSPAVPNAYTPLNPKPVPNFISSTSNYGDQAPGAGLPLSPSMASGQTPSLNKKANDGWNDLPLNVKEKPQRAKAGNIAPASLGRQASTPGASATPVNGFQVAPPPLSSKSSSRLPTLGSQLPPPPMRNGSKISISSNASVVSNSSNLPASNPYGPQTPQTASTANPSMNYGAPQVTAPAPIVPNPYAPPPSNGVIPPAANLYAPPVAASPRLGQTNPYAPAQSQQQPALASQVSPSMGPFSNGSTFAPPVVPSKPPVGPPPTNLRKKNHNTSVVENASSLLESVQKLPDGSSGSIQSTLNGSKVPPPQASAVPATLAAVASNGVSPQSSQPVEPIKGIPEAQQPIVDFLKEELARVTPLIPKEYTKQLKDCNKRLNFLFHHLEKQDLITQPTIEKLDRIVELMKQKNYAEAMKVHVDIATNNAQEGGNWLTGVKRLIGIAEATST